MNYLLIPVCIFISSLSACTFISPEEKKSALDTHNQLRAIHGAPALEWSHQLAFYAGIHASRCIFQHSIFPGKYGQNIAMGYPSISDAIKAWYSEIKYYSYSTPGFSKKTGHFTQLVWKSTTHLGCAYIDCHGKNGTPGHLLVCNYKPAGNVINPGYFKKNVLPQRNISS